MRALHHHHGTILPLQRGMLRRHRWYQALVDARPTRRARSHAASYRSINKIRRAMHEQARRDREMWEKLSQWGDRFHSVNDPIEAEIYHIRCDLYNALAAGAYAEHAFERHYGRARAACERFNAKQEAAMKRKTWHDTDIGHFSPDEAWQRLRHAVRMYERVVGRS